MLLCLCVLCTFYPRCSCRRSQTLSETKKLHKLMWCGWKAKNRSAAMKKRELLFTSLGIHRNIRAITLLMILITNNVKGSKQSLILQQTHLFFHSEANWYRHKREPAWETFNIESIHLMKSLQIEAQRNLFYYQFSFINVVQLSWQRGPF